MDPYDLWEKRSPRQILEIAQSYHALNTDSGGTENAKVKQGHEGTKLPDWYPKDNIKPGTVILNVDEMTQKDIF